MVSFKDSATHCGRCHQDTAFVYVLGAALRDEEFVLGKRFGRQGVRGRPRNDRKPPRTGAGIDAGEEERQFALVLNEQE